MKRSFRKWIAQIFKASEQGPLDVSAILENLKPDPNLSGVLCASVTDGKDSFELRIDPDDQPVEDCLQAARKLLASIQEMNQRALSIASENLLDSYNESWREYSEMSKDGLYEDVSNPELKPSEFEANLKISSVSVIGQMVEFLYSDNGLFAGHSVVVTSFDGLNFADTTAEIFG